VQVNKIAGVGGIVAADRTFGLLERDFAPADIDRAVGAVLKPTPGVDSGAHRILLDLSRTANGKVQLVTTNFDLLFEKAAPHLQMWTPDDLPDLQRGPFDGIVHLHGMLDAEYEKSVGGNLVLSSAEFGRAYLSEGWATRFIRDATEKYSVVFVGYTTDDPPVQYLLEALNRDRGHKRQPMDAFQSGLHSEAAALWAHKGVTAIPYDDQSSHALLWQTLAAWAERARDPEAWRTSVLRRTRKGPEALAPHERGQVMHLAMTPDGVKAIGSRDGLRLDLPPTVCVPIWKTGQAFRCLL
jgi:SIR2-like protein